MNLDELEGVFNDPNADWREFCEAITKAFPDLLALARDGERYRQMIGEMKVNVEKAMENFKNAK